jgi:hypothetical protein
MFLNPVVRNNGTELLPLAAQVNVAATWLMRGGVATTILAIGAIVRYRRRPAAARTRPTVLLPADRKTA